MTPPLAETPSAQFDCLTKEEFERRVKSGELLIIYNKKVYNLDKWIDCHPGGPLVIRHLAGKDATDEINAFHPSRVYEKKIHSFYVGECTSIDTTPAQKEMLLAYRRLAKRIRESNLYDCNYMNYFYECIRYTILITAVWLLVFYGTNAFHFTLSALCLGIFWHQLSFTAHDAGHSGITHNMFIDNMIGIFIAGFLGGLSIGWWKKSHYTHHIVTNDPENDPDLQHLPFFAVSTRFFGNLYSTYYERILPFGAASRFFVSLQHYFYYPVLCFGRFYLYSESYNYLLTDEFAPFRKLELTTMSLFLVWFTYLLSHLPSWPLVIWYILLSHMITVVLHVQITLSHFGMSTEVINEEPFPEKMLRTSMDVDCPWWMDWFHGGLQFQAVHHLFPRVPRHNLRACQPFVKEFCKETGIQYHIHGFIKGNGIVIGALKEVADQVELLGKVAKSHSQRHFS